MSSVTKEVMEEARKNLQADMEAAANRIDDELSPMATNLPTKVLPEKKLNEEPMPGWEFYQNVEVYIPPDLSKLKISMNPFVKDEKKDKDEIEKTKIALKIPIKRNIFLVPLVLYDPAIIEYSIPRCDVIPSSDTVKFYERIAKEKAAAETQHHQLSVVTPLVLLPPEYFENKPISQQHQPISQQKQAAY